MFKRQYVAIVILFLFLSTFVACAHRISFDERRVLRYDFSLESLKHKPQPYMAVYREGDKTLIYLASKHLSRKGYPDLLKHPTIQTIKYIFDEYKPQAVVVEGITGDLTSKSFQQRADECKSKHYKGCGESFYALNLARQEGIVYVSGEPSDKMTLKAIKKKGYSEEDLLGYYVVRQIPQLKRHGGQNEATFQKQVNRWLKGFKRKMGIKSYFDYKEFLTWYADHVEYPEKVLDLTSDDSAPHGGKDATYIQKISNIVSYVRDQQIVSVIERMLKEHDRVLVVYGGSHLITQEPTLNRAMGKPEYIKVY